MAPPLAPPPPPGPMERWRPQNHGVFFVFNVSRVRAEVGSEALLHRAELRMLRQRAAGESGGTEQRLELYQVWGGGSCGQRGGGMLGGTGLGAVGTRGLGAWGQRVQDAVGMQCGDAEDGGLGTWGLWGIGGEDAVGTVGLGTWGQWAWGHSGQGEPWGHWGQDAMGTVGLGTVGSWGQWQQDAVGTVGLGTQELWGHGDHGDMEVRAGGRCGLGVPGVGSARGWGSHRVGVP